MAVVALYIEESSISTIASKLKLGILSLKDAKKSTDSHARFFELLFLDRLNKSDWEYFRQ